MIDVTILEVTISIALPQKRGERIKHGVGTGRGRAALITDTSLQLLQIVKAINAVRPIQVLSRRNAPDFSGNVDPNIDETSRKYCATRAAFDRAFYRRFAITYRGLCAYCARCDLNCFEMDNNNDAD